MVEPYQKRQESGRPSGLPYKSLPPTDATGLEKVEDCTGSGDQPPANPSVLGSARRLNK
jgi:hypothetical protein